MGAINYATNKYITVAVETYDIWEFDNEDEWNYYYDSTRDRVHDILTEKEPAGGFDWFSFEVVPGYYEGFQLDFEFEYPDNWADEGEQTDALNEVLQVKDILVEAITTGGMCVTYPGWGTGYATLADGLCAINKACDDMIRDIKAILVLEVK